MVELILLILVVISIWKFSGTIDLTARTAEETTARWAEEVITDVAVERTEASKNLDKKLKDLGVTEIVTHSQYMAKLGIKR